MPVNDEREMQEPERLDLRSIDPDADADAADRFVRAVMGRIDARPVPLVLPADPLIGIWSITRSPALAAGILIAIAASAIGLRLRGAEAEPQTVEQAVGVPAAFLAAVPPAPSADSR